MADFELFANKNILEIKKRSAVTSGSVKAYSVAFTFSPEWDGLEKRMVFCSGMTESNTVAVTAGENGVCTVPWEVLKESGKELYAGVYGTNGDGVVLPTIWACIGRILQGAGPGEDGKEPTPDAWTELAEEVKEAKEVLADIQLYSQQAGEWAVEAADSATSAAESANTAMAYSGKPPIIQDGTWRTWDAESQSYTDTGQPARGETGTDGQDGKSAYQAAQDGGYGGGEAQFNEDLAGIHEKASKEFVTESIQEAIQNTWEAKY